MLISLFLTINCDWPSLPEKKIKKHFNYCIFKPLEYKYKLNFLYKNKETHTHKKNKLTNLLVREKELDMDLMRQRIWREGTTPMMEVPIP